MRIICISNIAHSYNHYAISQSLFYPKMFTPVAGKGEWKDSLDKNVKSKYVIHSAPSTIKHIPVNSSSSIVDKLVKEQKYAAFLLFVHVYIL